MVLRLLLYVLVLEALFIAYDVHAGHERLAHLGLISLLAAFSSRPWLSLSSSNWVYAINDKGIYLRDSTNVINSVGFNIVRWDQCKLLGFHLGEWRGYPALFIKFEHKGRERAAALVFRAKEASPVNEKLIPWLASQAQINVSDTTLAV